MGKKDEKLLDKLLNEGEEISKADRIKLLIKAQKGLFKKRSMISDFREPVLFLKRRNGDLEFYDNATKGKFVFKHSNGQERYAELRPQDQLKFNYGERRVRCYLLDEDRPFSGFGDSALDSESIMLAINKVNATKLKYEESLLREKRKGMKAWVWILLAIAGFFAIVIFALGTWGGPIIEKIGGGGTPVSTGGSAPAIPGVVFALIKGKLNK